MPEHSCNLTSIDPGPGYRLVDTYREPFYPDAEFWTVGNRWSLTNNTATARYCYGLCYRVRTDAIGMPGNPSESEDLAALLGRLDALTTEHANLRKVLIDTETRLNNHAKLLRELIYTIHSRQTECRKEEGSV